LPRIAVTRGVSPAILRCELTHLEREPIDFSRACAQHDAYIGALEDLGCRIVRLPADPDLPDSVFVEDAAVVLDEVAILTRPGATSRRPEVETIRTALAPYRPAFGIQPPATLDGGDVLVVGKRLYVGASSRSDARAVEQLRGRLAPLEYQVIPVSIHGCLHLKSAVTQIAPDCLLFNTDWVDGSTFADVRLVCTDPEEPFAANALLVSGAVIYPSAFPRTQERIEAVGVRVVAVDVSELAKAEGGVTCCSLIFDAD
jgi:dimethylargininase